jgi:antitoxin MazE7
MATMATETATIRVSRETRDRLAEQARARGVSLSAMLAELAREAEREAAFRAEREASRVDAGDAVVRAEEREWEAALGDGIG